MHSQCPASCGTGMEHDWLGATLSRPTLLWHDEHVPICVGQAAVLHAAAGSVHVDCVAVLASRAAGTGSKVCTVSTDLKH